MEKEKEKVGERKDDRTERYYIIPNPISSASITCVCLDQAKRKKFKPSSWYGCNEPSFETYCDRVSKGNYMHNFPKIKIFESACTSRKKTRIAFIMLKLFQFLLWICGITSTDLLFYFRYFVTMRLDRFKFFNFFLKRSNVRFQLPVALIIWKILPFHKIFFFFFCSPDNNCNAITLSVKT